MALLPKSGKAKSWTGLVNAALVYGHDRKLVTDTQLQRYADALMSDDMDELLGVAEFAGRKLGAPTGTDYARWLRSTFDNWPLENSAMANALRAIAQKNILIATLNYDTSAEAAARMQPIVLSSTEDVLAWCRKEREGVLHLHGTWTEPVSCVFGIRDYQSTLNDQTRDLVQRSFSSLNRLLFVGCGDTFADPNFSGLISWLRANVGAGAPQHYALVREDEFARRMADPKWRGFVEPLSYGGSHNELPAFLLGCFPTRPVGTTRAAKAKVTANRDQQILDAYRNFLLRDCGEMAIEGMRADMDTAQRKFDLEKLFVPLEVQPFPPQIPLNEPERDTKLQDWYEKFGKPIAFAKAFSKNKRIALLALPGGGKTLLLKRLAVAYCDPKRREASPDALPNIDLIPVMIRCREWKDHIRKPINSLLQEVAGITGDQKLQGLAQALEKPLKAGNVLLLIDGLDEIHEDGDRAVFVENLEKFSKDYPRIRLLVSSREAGFDLVAPWLARFCIKYKIAPLNADAIRSLSNYWHRLMSGGSPGAIVEADVVANTLLNSEPLRRLAENPLLLTMLLVVKHGAGRLPPDRVSLYDRAVEVLLDSWNIQGHEALNMKEAVPQLACLAFELMRRGQQTATEREILAILESARAELPMIGRYAKDSPHEFLKRVELRSSLMLQGGLTNEDGRTVPFYQFRHLTFQEYLAAVAAVEGDVLDASAPYSIVATIGENLLSDEWKEVVPMAAVLARGQATPLLEALTTAADAELLSKISSKRTENFIHESMPRAAWRLTQAMAEEAVFAPELLERAARIIVYFSTLTRITDNWSTLGRGPYGPDLRRAALDNYLDGRFTSRPLIRNTLCSLEGYGQSIDYWRSDQAVDDMIVSLSEDNLRSLISSIAATGGSFMLLRDESSFVRNTAVYESLERTLFDDRPDVHYIGAWAWGFWRHLRKRANLSAPIPSSDTLIRLTELFVRGFKDESYSIGFVFGELTGTGQGVVDLSGNRELVQIVNDLVGGQLRDRSMAADHRQAILRLAYWMPKEIEREVLRQLAASLNLSDNDDENAGDILEYLGVKQPKLTKRITRSSRRS